MSDQVAKSGPPRPSFDAGETTQVLQFDASLRSAVETKRSTGVLTLLTGDTPGTLFVLDRDSHVLGRSQEADVQIVDEGLSRLHARVTRGAEGYLVEDMDSTNGTFVNGERVVGRCRLIDGDRLQIGKQTVLRFSLQDQLEQEAAQRMYESMVRDPLTGLYNRRYLDERLAGEFAYAVRHRTPLSVLAMDVDHFKRVNDTLGHPAGDAVLQAMADVLKRIVRAEDLAARYGGEEFVVVARGVDREGAAVLGERIRQGIEDLEVPWEPTVIRITISVGVADLRHDRTYPAPSALIATADGALYNAKREGRNRVVLS